MPCLVPLASGLILVCYPFSPFRLHANSSSLPAMAAGTGRGSRLRGCEQVAAAGGAGL